MIRETLFSIKEYLEKKMGNGVSVELDRLHREADTKEHEIVITLLHIEEETSHKSQSFYWTVPASEEVGKSSTKGAKAGDKVIKSPDIDINLVILISSQASQYETALRQISDVISIMNSIRTAPKPAKVSAELFENIRSLNISLQNMSLEQNLSMWQTLGGNMVPSVVYKVRTLTVAGIPDMSAVHEVGKVSVESGGMDTMGKSPKTLDK